MIKSTKYLFNYIFLLLTINVCAQVEIEGLVDIEIYKGGEHSEFYLNGISSEFKEPHVGINQLNLFLYSQISEEWSVNGRLQFDTWVSGELNPLRLSLAEVVWEPMESPIRVSAGRFVNPFGLYPQRQLSVQNLFVNTPLAYGYGVNITNQHGYVFVYDSLTSSSGGYGYGTGRLTTISYAGYSTGAMFSWLIVPEVLNLDLAFTNAALTSQKHFTNIGNFGGIARLSIQPAIFWQQGISYATGGFMESAEVNQTFDNLTDFNQSVFGTDWVIAYTFFELSGEFIYSTWNVPGYDTNWFETNTYGNLKKFKLENYSYYFDLKYEPSFLPGSYVAARYEELKFVQYKEGTSYYQSTPGVQFNWGEDVKRYSVALGYKFSPNVLFKVAFSDQEYANDVWQPKAYTIRSMLSASF